MGGRALTVYEKVYPESELNTEAAHQALLDNIERCLPADCQPIILSDAIFKTPWFEAIEKKLVLGGACQRECYFINR